MWWEASGSVYGIQYRVYLKTTLYFILSEKFAEQRVHKKESVKNNLREEQRILMRFRFRPAPNLLNGPL